MTKLNNFEFRDILLEYHFRLNVIKTRIERGEESLLETSQERYINLKWYQFIRDMAFDKEEYLQLIKDKRTLNRKEFLLPEDKRCPGCEDGRPYMIIKYREVLIPGYDDDYGQQDFAVIFGEDVSGGAYNFFSFIEFINHVDYMLEKKFLVDDYDMKSELKELYPELDEEKE